MKYAHTVADTGALNVIFFFHKLCRYILTVLFIIPNGTSTRKESHAHTEVCLVQFWKSFTREFQLFKKIEYNNSLCDVTKS